MPRPISGEIKGYMAKGRLDNRFGNINEGKEVMMAVRHGTAGAKHARTLYDVRSQAGQKAAWVCMMPLTGRTHQLRLHMQLLGAPIAGDPRYMTDRDLPNTLAKKLHLHARSLELPREGKPPLKIVAELSDHMANAFKTLGFNPKNDQVDWEELK